MTAVRSSTRKKKYIIRRPKTISRLWILGNLRIIKMKARSTRNEDFYLPSPTFRMIGMRKSTEVVYVSAIYQNYVDLIILRWKMMEQFKSLSFEVLTIIEY